MLILSILIRLDIYRKRPKKVDVLFALHCIYVCCKPSVSNYPVSNSVFQVAGFTTVLLLLSTIRE